MGMDQKAKYVAAALATAALGACSGSPTEPARPPQSTHAVRAMEHPLGQLQRQLDGTTVPATPGVALPQDPFGSFFHS